MMKILLIVAGFLYAVTGTADAWMIAKPSGTPAANCTTTFAPSTGDATITFAPSTGDATTTFKCS